MVGVAMLSIMQLGINGYMPIGKLVSPGITIVLV